MKAFVFTDASLSSRAGQFVWLSLDGENPRNAAVVKRLKVSAYPTLFVIDPASEQVAIRWLGGATLPQLGTLLESGRAAIKSGRSGLDAQLSLADSLYGVEDYAGGAKMYEAVLAAAPGDWSQRDRVMDAYLNSLSNTDQHERVVKLAKERGSQVGRSTAGFSMATFGLGDAMQLPKENPERAALIADFEKQVLSMVRDPAIVLSADDRSGGYIELMDARDDAGDKEGKAKIAAEWSAFLDGEAAKAKTPEQRAVFDPHRLSAYIEIGHAEKAIPMLQQSEKDFPDDYNPPQRLAIAYNELKRYEEGLAASDRAMKKAYGPRKLRLYSTRTDLYLGKGDSTAARQTVSQALQYAQGLPEGQRSDRTIASLQKRLTDMGGTPAPPPVGASTK
jgi:tetratricopeptide (TPR) repeat protein